MNGIRVVLVLNHAYNSNFRYLCLKKNTTLNSILSLGIMVVAANPKGTVSILWFPMGVQCFNCVGPAMESFILLLPGLVFSCSIRVLCLSVGFINGKYYDNVTFIHSSDCVAISRFIYQ